MQRNILCSSSGGRSIMVLCSSHPKMLSLFSIKIIYLCFLSSVIVSLFTLYRYLPASLTFQAWNSLWAEMICCCLCIPYLWIGPIGENENWKSGNFIQKVCCFRLPFVGLVLIVLISPWERPSQRGTILLFTRGLSEWYICNSRSSTWFQVFHHFYLFLEVGT